MDPLRTLWNFGQFQDGLLAGTIVALPGAALGLALRVQRRPAPGLAGPAWVLASVAALAGWFGFEGILTFGLPDELLVGLALLFAGGQLAARVRFPGVAGFVLAVPGAALVARSYDFLGAGWVPWLIFFGTVLGAPLAADLDRRAARLGLGPVLLLVTVGGLYATVPDTELSRALLGAAIPVALLGWPLRAARIGAGGAAMAVALLLWVAAIDGWYRPGSIVGAAGALGLLVSEPVGRWLARGRVPGLARNLPTRVLGLVIVGAQVVLALYASRIAGFESDGFVAFLLLFPGLFAGVVFGACMGITSRRRPHRRRERPSPAVARPVAR